MRCPKCHYLSFDPEPRCKNCGYDLDVEESPLSMAPAELEEPGLPDLPLRGVESPAKPITLELVKPTAAAERQHAVVEPELVAVGAEPRPAQRRPAQRASHTTTELPLFVKTIGPLEPIPPAPVPQPEPVVDRPVAAAVLDRMELVDETPDSVILREPEPVPDPPVVAVPPANRPLSVRRPAAESSRAARVDRRVGPLHDDLLEDLRRLEREEARQRNPWPETAGRPEEADSDHVPMSARFGAAVLDGLLLGGIGAFVLWATLRMSDASPSNLGPAALVPLGVFLGGVSIAYLLMFTAAGGQTVGKMLMGIRVVDDAPNPADRLSLGQAAVRAVLSPLSFAMLGLGWLPAFFGRGLALHDRLAHTRVVRA